MTFFIVPGAPDRKLVNMPDTLRAALVNTHFHQQHVDKHDLSNGEYAVLEILHDGEWKFAGAYDAAINRDALKRLSDEMVKWFEVEARIVWPERDENP